MLRLKAITGSLILIMLVTNLVFGQYRHSPPGKVEIPLNLPANLSDHETIPFDNALNGPGDMFVIYSLYSDQNTILNSKIIPIHYQCDRFELLGDIGTLYPARDNFLLWEDIPEYGYQKSLPRSSLEDQEVLISSQEAAPNLNIRLDDGTTVCINLVYINFGEVSLVGHTKIMLSEVYDHTAIDLKTAREIPHTYRPDESWFAVKSHFAMTPDGKIQVSPEPIFWGRSTHGLYQSRDPLDNSVIGVGYSNYEFQALAFKETSRSEEILNTLIYASPPSTRSVVLTDRKGLDFQIDQTVWFSGAQFRGSAPFPSSEPYPYTIKYAVNEHPVKTLFTRSLLQSFLPQKDLSAETKTILGLATDRDDTDGDGLSDRLEILMNSDPTDPYTEGDELNDYQLYFEMGMFPPLNRRDFPAEMQAPKPKRYSFDGNPSTTIRPIAKKRGAPLEFKHKKLIEAGRTEEAAQVKRRFHNIAILTLYGEEALADYHRMDYYDRMLRFTPDWDTLLYGS
ncbi:hypothetical protein JW877_02700, partial [bacterium]|nr:hypothetical protein [bacterium]